MLTLLIETSSLIGSLALASASAILARATLPPNRKHARDLAPTLKQLLTQQSIPPSSLNLILVGIGPGSYTGLRVGIMTAKSLAYIHNIPTLGIPSLHTAAQSAPTDTLLIASIADAQQGRIYADLYSRPEPNAPLVLQRDTLIDNADAIANALPPNTFITGPALDRFQATFESRFPIANADQRQPSIDALLRLGLDQYAAGHRSDFWTLEPLYLRPSSAQDKWDRRLADADKSAAR